MLTMADGRRNVYDELINCISIYSVRANAVCLRKELGIECSTWLCSYLAGHSHNPQLIDI
jgi:hypothetical protein